MTISSAVSKASHQSSSQVRAYTFPFKVFDPAQLQVVVVDSQSRLESILTPEADYSVHGLGRDQGGEIRLSDSGAAKAGEANSLVIMRNMGFLQGVDYRPHDIFPAETHERALDILTMQDQQLREMLGRAVIAPADQKEPIQYTELLRLRDEAAEAAANAAEDLRELMAGYSQSAETARDEAAEAAASASQDAARAEEAALRAGALADLSSCALNLEEIWTVAEDIAPGTELRLPNALGYFPGRAMLHLSYDGVELYRGRHFLEREAGADGLASTVIINVPIKAGMELRAWVIASNVARHLEEAEANALAAAEAAARSAESAQGEAARAEAAAGGATQAQAAAPAAAASAAQDAARAEEAAAESRISVQGRCLATVQSLEVLEKMPSGFAIVDPALVLPATIQQPLTPVEDLDSIPKNMDGFYLFVPPFTEPGAGGGAGETGGAGQQETGSSGGASGSQVQLQPSGQYI